MQLGAVRGCYVGEVGGVVGVDVFGVGAAGLVAEVVPVWCSEGEFCFGDAVGGEDGFEVVPLGKVGAADVLYFAGADDGLAGLVAAFCEGGDVWD